MSLSEEKETAPFLQIVEGEEQRRYELSQDLVTLWGARHAEAEAIRTMRAHLMARHIEDGRRGLAMCAVNAGVGCTFSAVNLAVSLAQIGIGTLLIDGDLSSPNVDKFIRPLSQTPGLQQCIGPDALELDEAIHSNVIPNLSVLYSGGEVSSRGELLGSDPFKGLIERALRDYEFTIIDTPPASQSTDARRISMLIGYSVIVAKRNSTFFNELASLANELQEDGATVIGTVLNEVG